MKMGIKKEVRLNLKKGFDSSKLMANTLLQSIEEIVKKKNYKT